MSLPPPPDPFGSPSPRNGGGGQQWGGPPQQGPGGQPPYVGGPPPEQQGPPIHHGQPPQPPPPQGQHGAPPSWAPQQQWSGGQPPPPAPPGKGGKGKWILVGLALVAVIALSVVGTVLVLRPGSNDAGGGGGGGNPSTSATAQNGNSEFASADDTGPVNVITEEPTCAAWQRIASDYTDKTDAAGWDKNDSSIPSSAWTAEQRALYETVGDAMNRFADQTIALSKQTPHRVMRELYQQFIAYRKAFVAKIPSYVEDDRKYVSVSDSAAYAVDSICSAIKYESAQAIAPALPIPEAPSATAILGDPTAPTVFIASTIPVCAEWSNMVADFDKKTAEWLTVDAQIPAAEWSPEQRRINEAVMPIMSENADQLVRLGRASGDPVFEDFATLAAQYQRAYVVALPNYAPADNYLAETATLLVKTINSACKAV